MIERVWGGAAVTDDALTQLIKEVRRSLGDDPRNPRFVKTVPKSGYRFIGAVEELSAFEPATIETSEITTVEVEYEEEEIAPHQVVDVAPLPLPAARTFWSRSRLMLISGSLLVLIAAIALTVYLLPRSPQPAVVTLPRVPGRKTVAVMHLNNQSNTQELDWLREGVADMLISNLSRSKKLAVLNRQQLHLLLEGNEHKPGDQISLQRALDIAAQNQAEAVLLGSFAVLGRSVRIDLQLYDVGSGELLSTERLIADKHEQILGQVDLLSIKIASQLGASPETETPESIARAMTSNIEAYRYYSLALERLMVWTMRQRSSS